MKPPDDRVIVLRAGEALFLWLPGQAPRKSNQRVLRRTKTGKPIITKSNKALRWVELVVATMPKEARGYLGCREYPLDIELWCYYRDNRSDLSIELVLDALEKADVISNDRYVFRFIAHKIIDKEQQGVLVAIHPTYEQTIKTKAAQALAGFLINPSDSDEETPSR